MLDPRLHSDEVKEKLSQAKNITILTHLNPDADTIGTGLGIYRLLSKDRNKKIESDNVKQYTNPISSIYTINF